MERRKMLLLPLPAALLSLRSLLLLLLLLLLAMSILLLIINAAFHCRCNVVNSMSLVGASWSLLDLFFELLHFAKTTRKWDSSDMRPPVCTIGISMKSLRTNSNPTLQLIGIFLFQSFLP
jgi:hypothetical protein